MKKYDKITPEGTKDYLFKECQIRRGAENDLRKLFERFGYDEVMTTSLEFYDVFSQGVGRVSQNELYTLTDSSGRLLTMRPDSTKPIARLFSARLQSLPLPVKLFYRQPVFRRNIKYYKKSDEIMQMGVELIGLDSFKSDMETLILAIKAMKLLFGDNILIEIGHAGFIKTLLSSLTEQAKEVKKAIVSKNNPMLYSLAENMGEAGKALKEVPNLIGKKEVLIRAEKLFPESLSAIDQLKKVYNLLEQNNLLDNVIFDLASANDYGYYTGIVFKGYSQNNEILSGGRYNTLYSDYDIDLPAIGFALNLDEVVKILVENNGETDPPIAVIYYDNLESSFNLSPILEEYKVNGYDCKISLFEGYQKTMDWAKKINAKVIISIDNGKVIKADTL